MRRLLTIPASFGRLIGRCWRAVRGHLVTVLAFGLVSWAAFLVYWPAGLVISAVCLVLLERKVELDRRPHSEG
jgi:hypothetical protein